MTRIVQRKAFNQDLSKKQIDVETMKNDAQIKQAVTEAGGSVNDLAKADLNHDGKIQGAAETDHLYKALDDYDHNGHRNSFIAEDSHGTTLPAGKAYNRLGLLAANANDSVESSSTSTISDLGKRWAKGGYDSITSKMQAHNSAIDRTGTGLFYGDHSSFKTMTSTEKRDWIAANAKPGTNPAMPRESSCIGWALENVGAAYKAAGKGERWNEIYSTVTRNGAKGTDLAKELQKDGWEAVYWNPDAKHPDDNNAEHSFSASQVARGKPYYGIKVQHQVTDYRPTEGEGTKQDMSGIAKLKKVPFFFGLAKGGVHTFVGREGKVNEFHWSSMPDSKHAIEENPLQDFMWNSGVIMVPPGTWPQN